MSSKAAPSAPFAGEEFDWDQYIKYRPEYPAALFSRIFAFHEAHSPVPSFHTALDLACGPGNCVGPLLNQGFQKVYASDLNEAQLKVVSARFKGDDRVVVKQSRGEELDWIEDASVDLIVVAEAFHWFDQARFFEAAARVLKPGGTLAIWLYNTNDITSNEEASRLFRGFLYSTLPPLTSDAPPGLKAFNSLLDTVEVPATLFKHETRLKWLTSDTHKHDANIWPSAVGPDCISHAVIDNGFMSKQWTSADLLLHIETLSGLVEKENEKDGGEALKAMLKSVADALGGPDVEALVTWPLGLLMVSKP